MARPVQLPARGRAARQLRGLAVRARVRAARGGLRHRRRLEPVRAPDLRRRRAGSRRSGCASLGLSLGAGARRRARVRARALPRRPVDRAPARADLDAAAARALRRSSGGWPGSPSPRSPRSRSPARCTSRSARSRSCSRTRSRAAGRGRASRRPRPRSRRASSSGRRRFATRSSGRSPRSSATRPRSATSSPATRASSSASSTSAGCSRSPRVAGLGALCFRNTISRPRPLAAVLGLGALVPCLLALGANLPGYEWLWERTPLQATRVPGALPADRVPLPRRARRDRARAALCFRNTRPSARRRGAVVAAALLLVVADLWVPLYDPLNADEENEVYASLRDAPPGRLLELPVLPRTTTAGASISTTRCRRSASGRSATRPRRRRRRSRPRAACPSGRASSASRRWCATWTAARPGSSLPERGRRPAARFECQSSLRQRRQRCRPRSRRSSPSAAAAAPACAIEPDVEVGAAVAPAADMDAADSRATRRPLARSGRRSGPSSCCSASGRSPMSWCARGERITTTGIPLGSRSGETTTARRSRRFRDRRRASAVSATPAAALPPRPARGGSLGHGRLELANAQVALEGNVSHSSSGGILSALRARS